MNFNQTVEYLYNRLPVFQHHGSAALKHGLSGILKLSAHLGNPHKSFKSIHVAGTNGKGSTSHMLASILQSAGYKTGLYTSPHLIDFRERIRLNGRMVPKGFVINFVKKNKAFIEANSFSFFEVTVGMCFQYFAEQKIDIAVVEVGLGGRLDSTNIISPELSIITNISYDHKNILGDTLEKIAYEKAGIIKNRVPVVVSSQQEGIKNIFIIKAKEEKAKIYFATDYQILTKSKLRNNKREIEVLNVHSKEKRLYKLDLLGIYQEKNVLGVLQGVALLQQQGYQIEYAAIAQGLSKTIKQTGLMGRWQKIQNQPQVFCDTGHNEDGIRQVMYCIQQQKFKQLHIVFGVAKDKSLDDILPLLPSNAAYYFCKASVFRALDSQSILEAAQGFNLKGHAYDTVAQAYEAAIQNAHKDDLIYVGGSTFVVADLLAIFKKK